MAGETKRFSKLWMVIAVFVVVGIAISGYYRTLSAGDETYKGLKLFSDVIDLIEKNYVDPVDTKDLVQKAIQGMVNSLDPHSQLLTPDAFEDLKIDTQGEFGGIGIVITTQKGALTVISPIEGTPAYIAGVKAGDVIIKVDGASTKEMMLWEAVRKMRGPKGSHVTITIMREGAQKPMDFTLTRDIIPIESVRAVSIKPGYGYVRVTNFQENTTEDMLKELRKMESDTANPLRGIILDLRDNPGGLLDQAIQLSDVFLDKGGIVSIKGRHKKNTKVFNSNPNTEKREYPIIVLINGGSASASEIVAGALQDHKRAVVLGTTSFGKGSVQTVETLRDGYGLKFTIARYYTPNGRSIQAQGIVPDIEVKQRYDEKDAEAEDLLPKEKDLRHHLEAEPGDKENGQKSKKEPEPKEPLTKEKKEELKKQLTKRKTENRYGPLEVETLQSDYQVMRALEILIGHDVFKSVKSES